MDSGIGAAIRDRREDLGINQAEAARRLGVDVSTVSYWESGRFSPGADKLDKIAEFLDWRLPRVLKLLHETKTARARGRSA